MINLTITENEDNQRLDRFLKKYFKSAPLSYIYKLIRKDVKLNGRRAKIETMLVSGDELCIYVSEEEAQSYQEQKERPMAKKQFQIAYEDENIIVVVKPF
ncbi:MAG: RluA family pseudouridine synthase, partial [Anaerovorax sp.]